jgi:solute carrier family 45, member 1/2/4
MTAIIFAMLEPDKSVLHGDHPGKTPPALNSTSSVAQNLTAGLLLATPRQDAEINAGPPSGPNSVAIIFR